MRLRELRTPWHVGSGHVGVSLACSFVPDGRKEHDFPPASIVLTDCCQPVFRVLNLQAYMKKGISGLCDIIVTCFSMLCQRVERFE
jgi:hypothetical protein